MQHRGGRGRLILKVDESLHVGDHGKAQGQKRARKPATEKGKKTGEKSFLAPFPKVSKKGQKGQDQSETSQKPVVMKASQRDLPRS